MCLKPLNIHYSMENQASVYDEEAMTALELAGRTTAKVNEVVDKVNNFTSEMTEKHEALVQSVPGVVAEDVQKHIDNGVFDSQIGKYANNLEGRLNNLILNGEENSAEVLDIRADVQGFVFDNAGNAVREQYAHAIMGNAGLCKVYPGSINADDGTFYQETEIRLVTSLIDVRQILYTHINTGFMYRVYFYGEDIEYLGCTEWNKGYYTFDHLLSTGVHFVRFVLARENATSITTDDLSKVGFDIYNMDDLTNAGVKAVSVPFVNGTVAAHNGAIEYRESRLISPLMKAGPLLAIPKDGWQVHFICYDQDVNYLGATNMYKRPVTSLELIADTAYIRIIQSHVDSSAVSTADLPGMTLYMADTEMVDDWNNGAPAFLHEMMNTAYSTIGTLPINTEEHFRFASALGFNALKGDVRLTKDGELVMSHDAGYTLDADGHLTENYNSSNSTPWRSVNMVDIQSLTFPGGQPVCPFETYLQVCVETGKIAYITLRDEDIMETVTKVVETLRKYDMVDRCVINSYTMQTLETVRLFSRSIPVSMVISHMANATMNDVAKVQNLGNSILTTFYYPDENGATTLQTDKPVLDYAHTNGVVVHTAQVKDATEYNTCLKYGIKGFHLLRNLTPYAPSVYGMRVGFGDNNTVELSVYNTNTPNIFSKCTGYISGNYLCIEIGDKNLETRIRNLPHVAIANVRQSAPVVGFYNAGILKFPYDESKIVYDITIMV